VEDVRGVYEQAIGQEPAAVQTVGQGDRASVLIRSEPLNAAQIVTLRQALFDRFQPIGSGGQPSVAAVSITDVSGTWGGQITRQALIALVVFLVLVTIFLAFYFERAMAVAALVALVHDVVVTMGVYSIVGFEVTPATAIGLLTILGFSLYDTVVVFDKVKENTRGLLGLTRRTYSEAANLALNQTLMRSINTSLIAVLPVVGLMVVGVGLLGVGTLADLALVQMVGIIAGAASSVLLATPILVDLKQRDPRIREQARRVAARRARAAAAVAGAAGGSIPGDLDPSDDDALAGELRRERAMAAAAGVPSRTAPARRPAGSRERPTGKSSRPTGKRRR
jgi:preprotein translocase subunit SecF